MSPEPPDCPDATASLRVVELSDPVDQLEPFQISALVSPPKAIVQLSLPVPPTAASL